MEGTAHFRYLGWGWVVVTALMLIPALWALAAGAWLLLAGLLAWLALCGLLGYGLLQGRSWAWSLGVVLSIWLVVAPFAGWLAARIGLSERLLFVFFPLRGLLLPLFGIYDLWALLIGPGRAAWRAYRHTA